MLIAAPLAHDQMPARQAGHVRELGIAYLTIKPHRQLLVGSRLRRSTGIFRIETFCIFICFWFRVRLGVRRWEEVNTEGTIADSEGFWCAIFLQTRMRRPRGLVSVAQSLEKFSRAGTHCDSASG